LENGKAKITYLFPFIFLFLDVEPPVVDYCESPPEFITDTEDVEIVWDEPIFHDNSRYDHE